MDDYVEKQVPEKNIKLLQSGCPIHVRVSAQDVRKARDAHPDALLFVHPECKPEIVRLADFVGSTSAIMEYALKTDNKDFIIEIEIALQSIFPMSAPINTFIRFPRT